MIMFSYFYVARGILLNVTKLAWANTIFDNRKVTFSAFRTARALNRICVWIIYNKCIHIIGYDGMVIYSYFYQYLYFCEIRYVR